MKNLYLITFLVLGVNGANGEGLQNEQVPTGQAIGDDASGVSSCKNDSILDSLDKALKKDGYSLKSQKVPFGMERKLAEQHAQFPKNGIKGRSDSSREKILVEVPLTPEIIYDFMDKAIQQAKDCDSLWYRDITKGELNITEESKAGAAAFIAEALKNKVPHSMIEFVLRAYFKGSMKWDAMMEVAQGKKAPYKDSKGIPAFPKSKQSLESKSSSAEAR